MVHKAFGNFVFEKGVAFDPGCNASLFMSSFCMINPLLLLQSERRIEQLSTANFAKHMPGVDAVSLISAIF
jgi:hypothetical protein